MKAIDVIKWLAAVAISAFLAGVSVLLWVDHRIDERVNPQKERIDAIEPKINALIDTDTRAVRYSDMVALRTVAANRYVGARSGKGTVDADREQAHDDEAFILEHGQKRP